ncbi:hypothetical protein VBM87_01525 [Mycoplasma sp. 744]|uniref:hypothetical protein n=1 Tax=Mycoplasma sp. 744 TaxID=3108531 RepID=UPI002B1E6898|nr:hypothetical protein [Mycoplasma sp. 744]MEA4115461.1 hypothetical protein [Mycoplasma sp. 744]
MIKIKNALIYKSKRKLKENNVLLQYWITFNLIRTRFSIEKILTIFKWDFDAVKLNEFNLNISKSKNWNYEIFIKNILQIFPNLQNDHYQYELLYNFWSFYFYALMRYYFKKRRKLNFISVNSYNKKTINQNDIIKRNYYHNFLKLISQQENYNVRIRYLFTKLNFLLST